MLYRAVKFAKMIYFGTFNFELAVGRLGPPNWPNFRRVSKVPDPQAPAWRPAQIWAPKLEFPEIAQNHDCGSFTIPSGSAVHQDTLFFEIR